MKFLPNSSRPGNFLPRKGSLFTMADMEKDAPYMIVGAALGEILFEDGTALNRKNTEF